MTLHEDKTFSIHRLIRQVVEYHAQPTFSDIENLIGSLIEKMEPNPHLSRIKANVPWLKYSISVEKVIETVKVEKIAALQNYIAESYTELGQYIEALKYHQKALHTSQSQKVINQSNIAASCSNIADVHRMLKNYDKALEFNLKAVEIYEDFDSTNPEHLATSYNNLALIHQSLGDFQEAIICQEKSISIWQT